jgi:hypothetical protein
MKGRGRVSDATIDDLKSSDDSEKSPAIDGIFDELGDDSMSAARMTLALLNGKDASAASDLIDAARLLVFLKGNDAHDYKFSSAILEDYYNVSPEWRNQYLALNVFKLRSARDSENDLVQRARAALNA